MLRPGAPAGKPASWGDEAPKLAAVIAPLLRRLHRLVRSHGPLDTRPGLGSGVLALLLSSLALLGVLAFHFPEYLTTPELRRRYDVALLRHLLFGSLVLSGGIALANIVLNRVRWVSAATFALVAISLALGGHAVEVNPAFPDGTPYIGLDWFVLDLLGSALIFVFVEKLLPLRREQPIFRPDWQTDLQHFAVNHMLVGFMLLATNLFVQRSFGWALDSPLQTWVRALPFGWQLLALLLLADLVQYAVHRLYHEVPALWRLHSVHHSVEHMDWLAGSRMHPLEVLITRSLVLAPIVVLGFAKGVIDAYIVIVGFHAVLNHANVRLRVGPLRYLIVTPEFHHWHHAQDKEAIDRNYAAHFAFIDHLFGTAVTPERPWPQRYGVLGDTVPRGFWRQLAHPFRRPGGAHN